MTFKNTDDDYGLVAKFFHWSIAVMILALIPVGLLMGGMTNSPLKFEIFALHKSFGLLVFFLGLGRIIWRFLSPAPDSLESHQYWETTMAKAAHFWLYVCIVGMPLSGWLMSSAGEYPVPFFGVVMPALMGKNPALGGIFRETHEILGTTLMAILVLHMAGALKHHIFDRDETLERMTMRKKGWLIPALVVAVAGLSYLATIGAYVKEALYGGDQAAAVAKEAPAAIDTVDTSALPANGWAIVPGQSKLSFETVLYNSPFVTEFKEFKGTIIFNPNDLSSAFADITIGMASISSGDAKRDEDMKSADWFNAPEFPNARFVSKSFEKGGDGSYVAVGDVTIRGITMPLLIVFNLTIEGKKAHMRANFALDRTQFDVGLGQWNSDETVLKTVKVAIDLTAVQ